MSYTRGYERALAEAEDRLTAERASHAETRRALEEALLKADEESAALVAEERRAAGAAESERDAALAREQEQRERAERLESCPSPDPAKACDCQRCLVLGKQEWIRRGMLAEARADRLEEALRGTQACLDALERWPMRGLPARLRRALRDAGNAARAALAQGEGCSVCRGRTRPTTVSGEPIAECPACGRRFGAEP